MERPKRFRRLFATPILLLLAVLATAESVYCRDAQDSVCVNVGMDPGMDQTCRGGTAPGATPIPPPNPPPATATFYMDTVDPTTLYNLGCMKGSVPENGLTILDFGSPLNSGGVLGTLLFDHNGTFAPIGDIETGVAALLRGHWDCGSNPLAALRVGVGTSNYCHAGDCAQVSMQHGSAWADMIDRLDQYVHAFGWDSRLSIAGAIDIEPSWSPVDSAASWAAGYAANTARPYYNYGAADGCSEIDWSDSPCNNGWYQHDLWWVSWGVPNAYAVPEIYLEQGATAAQWQRISLYAASYEFGPIVFSGVLTQRGACNQKGCPPGVNNSPADGWRQLLYAVNSDPATAQPVLSWSTDISWLGE